MALGHALGLLTRRKLDAAQLQAMLDQRHQWGLPGLRLAGLSLNAIVHEGLALPTLANLALDAIREGRVCLLEIQPDGRAGLSTSRLMTVTGLEVQLGGTTSPRALLVLDPADAQPWACGHNARVSTSQSLEAAIVRSTSGHRLRARITGLIEWSAR